jgi:hypothetical protein
VSRSVGHPITSLAQCMWEDPTCPDV